MAQVDSGAIDEVEYDAAHSTLFVRFAHGDWYSYFAVPKRVHKDFMDAESKGGFFQDRIRDRFPYRKGRQS